MPEPGKNEKQDDFISRCIPIVIKDGKAKDEKQAAAICYSKWREKDKGKSIALSVVLKTDRNGPRITWRAIANSGTFDQQGDRFDETFFNDLISNFWDVQDAMSRGQSTPPGYAHPDGMPIPQLDVAHYSFQLPKLERTTARVGFPTHANVEGGKCILRGHFDITPLGQAASKSVLADDKDVIKTSVGVWPDWDRVETQSDGRRVFKGGAGVAYLDHLALTAYPVDAATEISAEGQPMEKSLTVADDALQVLQDPELVKQLEAARAKVKSELPEGALVKAEDEQQKTLEVPQEKAESTVKTTEECSQTITSVTTVETDDATQAIAPTSEETPQESPVMMSLAKEQSDAISAIKALSARLEALEKSIPNLAAISDLATALNKSIEATKATEAQKVKSMLDNRGWLNLTQLYSARSATDNTIDGGARAKGPQETEPQAGGPIAGRFIKT